MEQILVTGGAGFIGSHTCEALLKRGFSVICIDNFDDCYDPKIKKDNIKEIIKNPNFKLYKKDITDYNGLKNIFEENNLRKIVHLAAKTSLRDSFKNPELYKKVNIDGTLNLLKLAKEKKIKKFVFASSSSVYSDYGETPASEKQETSNQASPYAFTKKQAEILCKEYSKYLNITCLRFFTVYGPRSRPDMAAYKFTKLISEGKKIDVYGSIKSKRDYVFTTDIMGGILSALERNFNFEIVNLGNSKPIELKYLIKLIEKRLNKKAKVRICKKQRGDPDITFADICKAKRLLNYEPKIGIEKGIRIFIDWFLSKK